MMTVRSVLGGKIASCYVGWPLCLVVFALVGCGEPDTIAKDSLFEDDHVAASHWPRDLADTSSKLRERFRDREVTGTALVQIKDLVSWTSEVAADTDLSEADWLPLHEASQSLLQRLEREPGSLGKQELADLESLCDRIDAACQQIPERTTGMGSDT